MPNQRLRRLIWWRKWTKRDWAVAAAAAGFAIFVLSFSLTNDSRTRRSDHPTQPLDPSATNWVPLTLLHNAKDGGARSLYRSISLHTQIIYPRACMYLWHLFSYLICFLFAVCLDGSLPGYHFQKGFGSGIDNWVLHIEGGGWCDTIESCSSRKETALGSSRLMDGQVQFAGILSHEVSQNPDFFNWNKVKIRYCDGASFAGHPESEFKNGTKLFFRGQLIWAALMNELLSLGLSSARQALLSGCSAGGLATLLHCDDFQEILPKFATVKCLADAGFFLREKDIAGHRTIESFYEDVVHLHGVAKSLDKVCLSRMESSKCFFPQEFIEKIKTPVFFVHPGYDFWQIKNIFIPDESDPHGYWFKCKLNIRNCSPSQIEVLEGYRNSLLKVLSEFQQNKERGMFINSCYIHCQTWMAETWHSPSSPRINNKTIAESVGNWFFNRAEVKLIDCPFPCNPTCYNMDFTPS